MKKRIKRKWKNFLKNLRKNKKETIICIVIDLLLIAVLVGRYVVRENEFLLTPTKALEYVFTIMIIDTLIVWTSKICESTSYKRRRYY